MPGSGPLDAAALGELLPGRWTVRATDFPMWLRGNRLDPVFEYRERSDDPLVLDDLVEYRTRGGALRRIVGVDRIDGSGVFVWRGAGILAPLRSRWRVTGTDGPVLAIRFERSLVTPAGADVLVREGKDLPGLRARVTANRDALGLTEATLRGLTWLRSADRDG